MREFSWNRDTANLDAAQWERFEELAAHAQAIAANWPGSYYGGGRTFTDAGEWLNWRLFQIVSRLESERGLENP